MSAAPSLLGMQFNALLADSIGQLDRFVKLLEQEQQLLVNGEVEALLELAEDKTAALHQLQNTENLRALTFARAGVDTRPPAFDAFVSQQTALIQDAWQRYNALAARARELNQLNGRLIHQHMQGNQLALNVLLAASGPTLYGANGQTATKPGGRLVGSA